MKILHLISQHPESTGSGFYLQNIITQANKAGHESFLVAGISDGVEPELTCIDRSRCQFINFGGEQLDFTIPGMSDVMPYPSTRFSSLTPEQISRYDEVFRATVAKAVALYDPDIIHSHHLWLATRAARQEIPHLPLVTSCHSTDLRQLTLCPHLREMIIQGCSGVDRVLSLSREQAEQITILHCREKETIDIIGGGFDVSLFTPQQKNDPPAVEILYAGKLSYAKGVDLLLEAFAELDDPRLHLHLAGSGSGPEAEHCLQLAESSGNRVTAHGRISQQELSALMQRCHIFVLPSFYEGLPLVLLEAMACGCRILTTDLPGCLELLEHADKNLANIISLPRMQSIDQPDPEEVPAFRQRIKKGIEAMAEVVLAQPSPDFAKIKEITEPYDWQSVFARIEKAYEAAKG